MFLATCEISHIFIKNSICLQMYCVLLFCSDINGIWPQPTKYLPFLSQQIYQIQACLLLSEVPDLLISLAAMRCLFECEITESLLRLCLRSLFGVHQFIKITVLKYFRIIIEYRNMSDHEQSELSPEDKKMFNILQIKIYDISQNVEILSRQLMPNQIKEIVAHSFSIFNQLKYFFEKSKVLYLYNLMRKIQINTVLMISLLTDKVQKQSKANVITNIQPPEDNLRQKEQEVFQNEIQIQQKTLCKKIRQLGGIYLYNQHYTRGLQYQNNKQMYSSCEGNNHKGKSLKRSRKDFLNTIMKQIDNKAEVQVQGVNDQIKNYIANYRQNTKMANLISCQKELGEIIDFFKLSQLQALNFLNKSPHYNDYTEDYINRLDEMERDIKVKQRNEKVEILEKMKLFIQKLKQKIVQNQKNYEEKNAKLVQYEKSLKKETATFGTQTYDNFEKRIKDLENKLKQQQQKYNILNEMRKAENSIEDQVYSLKNQIQVKNNQLKRIEQINLQLEDEIEYFKKIIRENKEKMSLPIEADRRRMKSRKIIGKDLTSKMIYDGGEKGDPQGQQDQVRLRRQIRSSELKQFKKARRYEKTGTSNGSRISFEIDYLGEIDKKNQEIRSSIETEQVTPPLSVQERQKIPQSKVSQAQKSKALQKIIQKTQTNLLSPPLSPYPSSQNIKQSIFKQQHKKNTQLRKVEEQTKVSFNMLQIKTPLTCGILEKDEQTVKQIDTEIIRQQSIQQSIQKQLISIEDCDKFDYEIIRRSQHKTTLKQRIDHSICSIKSIRDLQNEDSRKEGRSVSKKCIILKEKREKNIITTVIKLTNMRLVHQFDISINEHLPITKKQFSIYEKMRLERPSLPGSIAKDNNQNDQNIKSNAAKSKKKIGLVQLKKKQKANSKDEGSLQPIKNNKTVGSIIFSNKGTKKEKVDLSSAITMQISKHKSNSINPAISPLFWLEKKQLKMQDKAYLANLLYNGETQKINQQQELQRIHSNFYIGKEGKNGLKKHYLIENPHKFFSKSIQRWSYEDSIFAQNGFTNYLMQEMQAQNLNVQQFKQIMNIINVVSDQSHNKNLQGEQKKTIVGKNNDKKLQRKIILDGVSVTKLKEIHEKYSKCLELNKENKLCQHLQKYISIVKKIRELHGKYKQPLKLPIQKIGQMNDSYQNQARNFKTMDQMGQKYIKSHIVTDQNQEQKTRILPIINNTTLGYYKPKSKVVR